MSLAIRIRNRRAAYLLAFVSLLLVALLIRARAYRDWWVEVPRDGFSSTRVMLVLRENAIEYDKNEYFGVTYFRVADSDRETVVALLDEDSLTNRYPLNIKRRSIFNTVHDVIRNPVYHD